MIKPIKPACGEERIPLQAGDFLFCMQRRTCVAAACIVQPGEEVSPTWRRFRTESS